MSRLRQLHPEKLVLLPLLGGVIAGIISLVGALNRFPGGEPPRATERPSASAWSWLVETLNDPTLIAVVLFCLVGLVVIAGRLRWNEWYVATHLAGVETPGQVIRLDRVEDAELQARLDAWHRRHSAQIPKRH
jgi:hypothetical protein